MPSWPVSAEVRTRPEVLTSVGKESNRLEEVDAGPGHDPVEVWTEYADHGRDPRRALVLPVLHDVPSNPLAEASRWSIKAIRSGPPIPRPQHRAALIRATGPAPPARCSRDRRRFRLGSWPRRPACRRATARSSGRGRRCSTGGTGRRCRGWPWGGRAVGQGGRCRPACAAAGGAEERREARRAPRHRRGRAQHRAGHDGRPRLEASPHRVPSQPGWRLRIAGTRPRWA